MAPAVCRLLSVASQSIRVLTYRNPISARSASINCFTVRRHHCQNMDDRSKFTLPNDTGICLLECRKAFEALTDKEKLYAHYVAQASWFGSLVCLYQTSPESPETFVLFQKLFKGQSVEELKALATESGFSDDDFQALMIFIAGFYSNMGNYKSFGDTKIVPNLEKEEVDKFIQGSAAYKADPSRMQKLWNNVGPKLFSLTRKDQQLGLGDTGITTYFSGNCDKKDAEVAQQFLDEKDLSAYNTRLFKTSEEGKTVYEVRLASSETSGQGEGDLGLLGSHQFTPKGESDAVTFRVTRGDYSPLMKLVADNLLKAKECAANDDERNMLEDYAKSFSQGSINAHKDGSRHWIKNKGPIVESYIGFIESYRDPFGVRGEFEGFVAMVNKEMSAKFGNLVAQAEHFLPLLPWPSSYEKDTFLRPDFTSLEVLAFGSSGIPAGINIPNYDDIRQSEGFKNVSLGNVLSSGYKDTKITFLTESDKELFAKLKAPSFEVQVGLHELLGHGSGKLFMKNTDGTFNFDTENVKHTETGEKITSWYEPGESWNSKFQAMSPTYEECRAECVGIYLCLSSEILRIFGHEGAQADDIIYVNWLNMVRAGLLALEFYTPDTSKWGQAHMQARYVILRVLMEAGEGLASIERLTGDDGEPDLVMKLDRSKINTVGKKAIGDFLRKLQTYKATGDYATGKAMYDRYSSVTDNEEPHMLTLRSIVLKRKQPRKLFVQCNTFTEGEGVRLEDYTDDAYGLVQSFVKRFPGGEIDDSLLSLAEKDAHHFT